MKNEIYTSDISLFSHERLLDLFSTGFEKEEIEKISLALTFAEEARAQDSARRPRGIEVVFILQGFHIDAQTVQATLLSDPWILENKSEILNSNFFDEVVVNMVKGVHWISTFHHFYSKIREDDQVDVLRSMLLAGIDDVRAVLIMVAYRLQRLRLLHFEEESLRSQIAHETLDIFAPLVNRLGIGQFRWELEDLSFKYLQPGEYKKISQSLQANRKEREHSISECIQKIREELQKNNIQADVSGRPKHIYSTWKKMNQKNLRRDDIYDLLGIRIIVEKIDDCYSVLGLVHHLWKNIPNEFCDYIAHPKENGYQSLHTVVLVEKENPVEIQIRTQEMHEFAEFGVASHWHYKEGGKYDSNLNKTITVLRNVLEKKENIEIFSPSHSPSFSEQIFVFTPLGKVIRLPKGSTPIDFAYAIHTEVGHRCKGAKVNGHIVPLQYPLKSAETVEIIKGPYIAPNFNWQDSRMGYVVTVGAKSKIRQWFKKQDFEKNIRLGKIILEKERHRLNAIKLSDSEMEKFFRSFHLPRTEDVLVAIGRGDVTPSQIASKLKALEIKPLLPPVSLKSLPLGNTISEKVSVQGVRNLMMHFAQCCMPKEKTPIIGYVTLGYGISIHAQNCINILKIPVHKKGRLIDVHWISETTHH